MSDESLPTPWERSRNERHAARAARRRERHEDRGSRSEERGVRRRGAVAPAAIVDAALRILDTEGIDALTLRRLASELGTGVMTLYWYIANKDELLTLVADRVTSEIEVPPAGLPWQERVRAMAATMRRTMLRHPAAVPALVAKPAVGPSAFAVMEAALGILRDAGFDEQDAADGYFTLSNYVLGFCAWETAGGKMRSPDETASVRAYIASLPADRYPNLIALAPRVFTGSLDQRFEFGLDSLLDGMAARLRRPNRA